MWIKTFSGLILAGAGAFADMRDPPPPSPTCLTQDLVGVSNNAKEIAGALDGITRGITVRALGRARVMVCGDDTRGAVTNVAATMARMGREITMSLSARESHTVQLFYNRDNTWLP